VAKAATERPLFTDTAITFLDDSEGALSYRGYSIEDLVENCSFEEVAHLLWHGDLPAEQDLLETRNLFAAHRSLSVALRDVIRRFPASTPPMSVLRTAVSTAGLFDPRAQSPVLRTNVTVAGELVALMAATVATFHRQRQGLQAVQPDPGLSHAANLLYTLTAVFPEPLAQRAFEQSLILGADYRLDPSTLAARLVASTLSDTYSAVCAAIGALRGRLSAGEGPAVLRLLDRIDDPDDAPSVVKEVLKSKKAIPGFPPSATAAPDTRATLLAEPSRRLAEAGDHTRLADVADAVRDVMIAEKGLHPGLDFCLAPLYRMLDIPTDLFTTVQALGRVVGWTAHVLEQYADSHLPKLAGRYKGPKPRPFPPLAERD